uniref:Expansin-like CBD domain-containing protein n=1 Tax=Oryza rufipogon TaxID=4529 RepID=A0A0E0NNJ8_ORYRU
MASSSLLLACVVVAAMVSAVSCGPPKVPPGPNITTSYGDKWLEAKATWYGAPKGAGPKDNGGACGYKDPALIHVTDMNDEPIAAYHFDLSGLAFGAMAKDGKDEELRKAGIIDTQFRRVEIKEKGSEEWKALKESWGAIWRIDTPKPLKGPFSVRVTTEGGEKIIAEDAIPDGWKADSVYKSNKD